VPSAQNGSDAANDPMLWTAIENTRMVQVNYHGKDRLVEPHDHGILNGSVQLLSWQWLDPAVVLFPTGF